MKTKPFYSWFLVAIWDPPKLPFLSCSSHIHLLAVSACTTVQYELLVSRSVHVQVPTWGLTPSACCWALVAFFFWKFWVMRLKKLVGRGHRYRLCYRPTKVVRCLRDQTQQISSTIPAWRLRNVSLINSLFPKFLNWIFGQYLSWVRQPRWYFTTFNFGPFQLSWIDFAQLQWIFLEHSMGVKWLTENSWKPHTFWLPSAISESRKFHAIDQGEKIA